VTSHLDLNYLSAELRSYPDQKLVSFLVHGTATKSSACGLDLVLDPHLTSLSGAFDAVRKNVADLTARGWYGLFRAPPFLPLRSLPQGTAPKSDGTARRTTDAGAPRKPTIPATVSINEAARSADWVREEKPTLGDYTRDVAILRDAAEIWGEPVYQFSHDFQSFFNQLVTRPSEQFKSCFHWLDNEGAPAWVAEYVLGFGAMPSSGIAQRFSHAILWLVARDFDAEEALIFAAETDPRRVAYLRARAALGDDQARLWTGKCFTDYPIFAVVGAERTACLLDKLGTRTGRIRALLAAGPPKQQLGVCVRWNRAYINSFLAHVIILPHKALRALKTLYLVETGSAVLFRDCRSLCGLLEHIRFAVHQRRVRMYGLYSPFRALRRGASAPDPEQPVRITAEMTTRAAEWSKELVLRPGAWCSGILRQRFEASPSSPEDLGRCLFGYSDAALEGAATPCFGGWFHGSFFSVPIPVAFLVFAIPILEFLAAICAALAFRPLIGGALSS
jgi:hypothetical protein